ncbi:hypothetical protein [Gordonia insulae]|uniref:Uncharacterized protein n=1 Tax=Gordonia insulae TaxID=2420509 RepID=A0A3G8JHK1_9ACTN|nr:hypothetical protein [Gordonia insulae]AZG43730.1 hypothetical protein D7316_00299 [Gordonia insulae]
MTAANVSALVEARPAGGRSTAPVVQVAGAAWPLYKVHAVIAALIVAVVALGLTGSGQAVAWASAAALVTVWWTERLWQTAHRPS